MAVSIHNGAGGTVGSGQSSLSWNHALHADADFALVAFRNSANVSVVPTTVTFGGVEMHFAFEHQDPDVPQDRSYVYWLPAAELPAPGTRAVVVNWAAATTDGVAGVSVCLGGAAQEAPSGITAAVARGITDVNHAVTTTEPSQQLLQFLLLRTAATVTADSGQATLVTDRAHALTRAGPVTPGVQAMDVTLSTTSTFGASVVVPVAAAAAGGGEVEVDVAFAGVGTVTAAGRVVRAAMAAAAGAGAMGAVAVVRRAAAVAATGVATLTGAVTAARRGRVALSAAGTLSGSASAARAAQVAFAANGTFFASSSADIEAVGAFAAHATLSTAASVRRAARAALGGSGALATAVTVRRATTVHCAATALFRARVRTPAFVADDVPRCAALLLPGRPSSFASAGAEATFASAYAPATLVE